MVIWRGEIPRYRIVAVAFLMALLIVAAAASSSAAAQSWVGQDALDTIDLPPEALAMPADFSNVLSYAKQPKLDSAMSGLATVANTSRVAAATFADSTSLKMSGNNVYVQMTIQASGLEAVTDAVSAVGGEITGIGDNDRQVQGWVPADALETLSAESNIYYIRRPQELVLLDEPNSVSATTEGLAVINGPAWHSAGHTGGGVKVGIIDGGFEGYTGLLGSDLPTSVTVRNLVDGEGDSQVNGSTPHGTAVAEIIHDIAPDASLYLAKVATPIDLEEAVNWLRDTQDVDVISTSIGWYNVSPGDGTGYFANLVSNARNDGILWATAAGNERERHWGGPYTDNDNDDVHEFNGPQQINYFGSGDGDCTVIGPGFVLPVFLRWNDWSNVDQDYDLLLFRWNGSDWEIVAVGANTQDGSPGVTPTELAVATTSGSATCYGFAIVRYKATRTVDFEVFTPVRQNFDEFLAARSLPNLADSPAAMTVAALDVTSPYQQERYSSEGPTNGPGGAATGGIDKPEIAAFANVATESYEGSTFNGTSSATPHVSGAAALVRSAYPGYTADQVQSFLEQRAIDMGPSGADTRFGHGRLHLGDPPTETSDEFPKISVSSDTLSVALASDSQSERTLSIGNVGEKPLTWKIDESQSDPSGCGSPTDLPWLTVAPLSGTIPDGLEEQVTVTFDSTGLTTGVYTGTLCIGSNDPNSPLVATSVRLTNGAEPGADLAVTVADVVDPVKQGDDIRYVITVDNTGPDPAETVTLTSTLPAGVNYDPSSSSNLCSLSGLKVVCNLGIVTVGSRNTVPIVASTNSNTPDSVTHRVAVGSNTNDPNVANNTDSEVTTIASILKIFMPTIRTPIPRPSRLEVAEDTTVMEGYPDLNACSTFDMWAGHDQLFEFGVVRSLVKFDVSDIPMGAVVSHATLHLSHYGSGDRSRDNAQTISSFRVGSPWSACSVNWHNQPGIGEAYGSVSVPFSTGGSYAIDVTGLVRGWVSGVFPNHGLWLRGPEARDTTAWRAFYTADSAYEPYISLEYLGVAVAQQIQPDLAEEAAELDEAENAMVDMYGLPAVDQMCQATADGFECIVGQQ